MKRIDSAKNEVIAELMSEFDHLIGVGYSVRYLFSLINFNSMVLLIAAFIHHQFRKSMKLTEREKQIEIEMRWITFSERKEWKSILMHETEWNEVKWMH